MNERWKEKCLVSHSFTDNNKCKRAVHCQNQFCNKEFRFMLLKSVSRYYSYHRYDRFIHKSDFKLVLDLCTTILG